MEQDVEIEADRVRGVGVTRVSASRDEGWDDLREFDDPRMYEAVSAAIGEFQPDIVHVLSGHRVTTAAIRSAHDAGVPVVLTAMDFWLVCPRITLRRGTGELCHYPADPLGCVSCLANEWRRYRIPHRVSRGFSTRVLERAWHEQGLRPPRIEVLHEMIRLRRSTMPTTLEQVDALIVASRFVGTKLAEHVARPDRIRIMRQGLDTNQWHDAEPAARDGLHIGYVGQIAEHKGVFDLVNAFRELPSTDPMPQLIMYGDLARAWPASRSKVERLADSSPGIILAGSFDNRDIRRVHANLDVLVVPSRWYENSPNVILEAFACGTPVVASDLGGMAELVTHEVNGLLFPAGDVTALGRALQRLIDEPGLLPRLRAGIPPVKTIDEEMADLTALYEEVIAASSEGR